MGGNVRQPASHNTGTDPTGQAWDESQALHSWGPRVGRPWHQCSEQLLFSGAPQSLQYASRPLYHGASRPRLAAQGVGATNGFTLSCWQALGIGYIRDNLCPGG